MSWRASYLAFFIITEPVIHWYLIGLLGMAVTISIMGILSILVKQGFRKLLQSPRSAAKVRSHFENITGIAGSLTIVLLGIFLLIGSMS